MEPLTSLKGLRVVLGVSGGIAAYKSVELCRRLVDSGAHVVPVMTEDAHRFIGEVTLSALASEKVQSSLWDEQSPIPHTRLGQEADVIVVAPATTRVIAAYRVGLSYDLLTATLLATRAPVVMCPAMHTEMWEQAAVMENVGVLRSRGVVVVDPQSGRLAGGDTGTGRLADPETILDAVVRAVDQRIDLRGVSLLVTAGGTREPIDAVRVIANRSSGKQGYAVAEAAARRGASVTLVSTVDLPSPPGVAVVRVETAAEMLSAVTARSDSTDVVVMAAAVADFRPVAAVEGKIKKDLGVPQIVLEPTVDVLAELGKRKPAGQTLVGFAAETSHLVDNAVSKLKRKNLDLIVANNVADEGVGFGHDTNAVTIISRDGGSQTIGLADKRTIAEAVLDSVVRARGGSPR